MLTSLLQNQYGDEVAKQMLLKEKQDREAARRAAALGSSDPNMIPLGQRPTQNTEAAEANEDEDEEKVRRTGKREGHDLHAYTCAHQMCFVACFMHVRMFIARIVIDQRYLVFWFDS